MDDQTIQAGADNIKEGQPLPDPEQIDTGSGFDEEGHRKDIELRSLVKNINNIAFSSVNSENVRHGIKQALSIYSHIEEAVTTLKKWLDSMPDAWADIIEQSVELDAYLVEELKKPEYGGRTFDDLIADLEEEGWKPSGDFPEGTLARKAWDAAKEARRAAEGQGAEQLPKITYQDSYKVKTVTDKLFNDFFSLGIKNIDLDGQRQFLSYERQITAKTKSGKMKEKKEYTLIYDVVQKNTAIEKKFSYYDLFVAAILDNLLDEGNKIVSVTKIWHELGKMGTPSDDQIKKLVDSLQKGMSTIMTIDDIEVQRAWGNKRSKQIISPVMPVQIVNERYTANGKIADTVIHIMGHTPFYMVAAPLKHLTEWDKSVLRLYKGRRTERYYNIMWYLLRNIGWMRTPNSQRSNKITYKDIYVHNGDESTRDKQLTWNMIHTLLNDVFVPAGYVAAYKEEEPGKEPGVILTVTKRRNLIGDGAKGR